MMAARQLHVTLSACPICGSNPRRYRRKSEVGVVCYAGSHRLQSIGDNQSEADRIWNDMAADWAARNSRESQIGLSLRVIEAVASINHIATAVDSGLNSHAAQLRDAARTLSAALSPEGRQS